MGMVDGHGALEKEENFGWEDLDVYVGMVDGHGAFEKEEDSGWEDQDINVGMVDGHGSLALTRTTVFVGFLRERCKKAIVR